jgi:serine/threonine protein kinase
MKPKKQLDTDAENPGLDTSTELIYDFKVDLYSAGLVLYRMCRYFVNGFVIKSELERIQHNGSIDKNKLSHQDDILHQLLDGLLKRNPEERLSASQALACFEIPSGQLPPHCLSETDGPRTPKVLARKSSSSSYFRVHSHDARSYDTLLTCLIEDLKINDIECFNIIEESDWQIIKNSTDWEILLSSANRRNHKVKLVVEPKSEDEPDLC